MPAPTDGTLRVRLKLYRRFLGHRRHVQGILAEADIPEVASHARARVQAYDRMLDQMVVLFPELRHRDA